MLAKTLLADTFSVLLALGSFAFYLAGFFYPEVHRRTDLVWSGLGLLYAALLWFCAGQMTVAVLLAQLIVVVLLLGLGWQTLSVRREKTPVYQQTPIAITPEVVSDWTKNRLNQLRIAPKESVPVRLEKRASGQQLDPRRRRAYDYEFVEDGLVEMTPATDPIAEATEALSEVLSLEVLPLEAAQPDEGVSEILVDVPPSVEAKIISVEDPEATEPSVTDLEATEPSVTAPEATEPSVTGLSVSEPATDASEIVDVSDVVDASVSTKEPTEDLIAVAKAEPRSNPMVVDTLLESESVQADIDASEFDASAADSSVPDASAADSSVPDASASDSASDEDWDDELFDDTPTERTPVTAAASFEPEPAQPPATKSNIPPIAATREKPSLLATPVILVGWVKDVVTSLTRPKPSKPVIEIPRREPPSAIRNQTGSTTPTAHSTATSHRTAPTVSTATSTVTATATPPAETEWGQEKNEASYAESASAIAPQEDNWEESNWDD